MIVIATSFYSIFPQLRHTLHCHLRAKSYNDELDNPIYEMLVAIRISEDIQHILDFPDPSFLIPPKVDILKRVWR